MRALALALAAAAITVSASAAPAAAAPRALASRAQALTLAGVGGSVGAVVSDARWGVRGSVAPYVPGQSVTLELLRNGRRILTRTLRVHRDGRRGTFATTERLRGIGRITVRVISPATPSSHAVASRSVAFWLVAPHAQPGERSYAVRILQHELTALHYVVGAPAVDDAQTQQAVIAFRKMAGLTRNDVVDASVFRALAAGAGVFTVRYPSQGRHIEADLTHQVLALIGADGVVQRIYQISSGKPSTPTQLGNFAVYDKTPGINSLGMVDSSYFNGGDAIHGYAEVPPYAASHGCLRVWIPDAPAIYAWATLGTPVDVYYR